MSLELKCLPTRDPFCLNGRFTKRAYARGNVRFLKLIYSDKQRDIYEYTENRIHGIIGLRKYSAANEEHNTDKLDNTSLLSLYNLNAGKNG
jgi:hypothetical protein